MLAESAALTALKSDDILWTMLFEIGFTSNTSERFALAEEDITVDGNTWKADFGLVSVSPIGADNEPSESTYSIGFADPVAPGRKRWETKFTENGYIGISLEVSMSFLTSSGWTNALKVYQGICTGVTSGPGSGGIITSATFAGPLAKLDDASPLTISRSAQRQRLSTDSFLDEAHIAQDIQFGKLVEGTS